MRKIKPSIKPMMATTMAPMPVVASANIMPATSEAATDCAANLVGNQPAHRQVVNGDLHNQQAIVDQFANQQCHHTR